MRRVLVVEDEKDLAELLAFNLEKDGYQVACVHDGRAALTAVQSDPPDLILLDLMLPGLLGTEVCKALQKDPATAHIPVIMVTAKGDEIDRVVGFEVGAADYIVKPFSMRELMLRIKSLFRRMDAEQPADDLVVFGGIVVDRQRHQVTSDGNGVELTSTEYKLLLYLLERSGRVVTRDMLLQNVWGYNASGDTRTVDTHVTRLRNKLGAPGEMIRTVRGFGYKMEEL